MDVVVQAAVEGLATVFSWPNILYPIAGTLLAMLFAVIPGVSGVTLMALAIPATLAWEPIPVLLLFGSFVGGGTFMGSVSAILFNIPGTAPSAATMLDGYPMAQRGEAKTALACSATASALGSSFGVLILILFLPFLPAAVLALGPLELFLLILWGLTTIAVVTQGMLVKGLGLAGVGLLLSFIGFDPRTAEARYTLGSLYLQDGLSLVPVFLGMFAMAEVIDLVASGRTTISGEKRMQDLKGSSLVGIRSVFTHFGLFIRCSTIGAMVGVIPGIGGTVASFLAYGHAVQTAENPDGFGHGDIRGVLAPEAANDAKDGGSLLPTLALGVPGSLGTAILLSVLTLHGVTPGTELMTDGLGLVFVLIWSLTLSNWLTSLIGLALVGQLTRLTVVRTQLLVPFILMFASWGAFVIRGRIVDMLIMLVFGFVGYFMKRYGWPRVAFVIALVLGPPLELNLHMTLRLYELGRINLFDRPIAIVLLVLTAISLILPFASRRTRQVREQG